LDKREIRSNEKLSASDQMQINADLLDARVQRRNCGYAALRM
jgi:hypothetical protein